MTDARRVGQAQRRRIGASPNMYSNTMLPPSFGPGDTVTAKGRRGPQAVVGVIPNVSRPGGGHDGHGYVVQGGKKGRRTVHPSGELVPSGTDLYTQASEWAKAKGRDIGLPPHVAASATAHAGPNGKIR
jgi:hypothetical protein